MLLIILIPKNMRIAKIVATNRLVKEFLGIV
jgi:hypothetical protein